MTTKFPSEVAFKRHICSRLRQAGVWHKRIEPGHGSDIGMPDLIIQFQYGHERPLVFFELKVGIIKPDGSLLCTEVRPAQMSFFREFKEAGGKMFFLVGVLNGKVWTPYVVTIPDFMAFARDHTVGVGNFRPFDGFECRTEAYLDLIDA